MIVSERELDRGLRAISAQLAMSARIRAPRERRGDMDWQDCYQAGMLEALVHARRLRRRPRNLASLLLWLGRRGASGAARSMARPWDVVHGRSPAGRAQVGVDQAGAIHAPHDPVLDAEAAELRAMVKALPPREGRALTLRYLLGCSGTESARAMRTSADVVSSLVSRGLKRLRRQLTL